MSEELEIFLEDCEDQLQAMEDALVELETNGVSLDSINAIFRTMHTIKGSAGMFGFSDIVTFAHAAENLLDEARNETIETTPKLIELLLESKDHLEKLIEAQTNERELSADERSTSEALIKRFESFMSAHEGTQEKELSTEEIETINDTIEDNQPIWHISIRLKKDFYTTGMSITSILNFLNNMGELLMNRPIIYNIPPLEELNPLEAYLGFELLLRADTDEAELEDVFEFVKDDVDLLIFKYEEDVDLTSLINYREEPLLKEELLHSLFYNEKNFMTHDNVEIVDEEKKSIKEDVMPQENLINESKLPESKTQETEVKSDKSKTKETKKASSLRVDSSKIDFLINHMSEIVITNSKIMALAEGLENTELEEASIRMKELLELVRDGVMDMRMVQVGESFNKFKRIVNDTAKKIGKDVEFVITGGETELDKTVVEKISDPLVHMLRNSIDHGVELPNEREEVGKRAKGRVDLRAYPDSGTIVIEIEDDGKGLDKEKILNKAISNGIIEKHDVLSDSEIYKLIFAAGLSTADKVSDISGRGVGMDVVKRNIEDLRGTIDIDSTLHKGSKITIRLPLTLAIIDGFLVQVGSTKYIIPLDNIQECIELTKREHESMKDNKYINLRGEMLPIMDVRDVLNEEESSSKRKNIVIVHFGEKMIGLLVDELLGEHQTVIKSLGKVFENVPGISGGSILGSGEVALIFDIARLIEHCK